MTIRTRTDRLPRAIAAAASVAAAAAAAALLLSACMGTAATPTQIPQAAVDPWAATPSEHRGMDGHQVEYECPAGGTTYSVWGTDVYTDDSSICTAAVHAGVITLEEGGTVTIEIRAAQDAYEGSERNGITSLDYGSWGGSYVIIEAPEG